MYISRWLVFSFLKLMDTTDFDFKIVFIVFFFLVSVFALVDVLTPLKYSLFFANSSLSWVFFGLLTFGTCCLSLIDVFKPEKYHTLGRKGSTKRKAFFRILKEILGFLRKSWFSKKIGHFFFFSVPYSQIG